MTFTIIQGHR